MHGDTEDKGDGYYNTITSSSGVVWHKHTMIPNPSGIGMIIPSSTYYVGVTQGKTYSLTRTAGGQPLTISYSSSINNQTPTVTDY